MGVDVTVLSDHDLALEDLYDLPSLLNAEAPDPPSPLRPEDIIDYERPWRWNRDCAHSSVPEELVNAGHLSIEGPAGFFGTAFRSGIELCHLTRWWAFVHDARTSDLLMEASTILGRVWKASCVVYLPDSAFLPELAVDRLYDAAPFIEVVSWLSEKVGPPMSDPSELRQGEDVNPNGYILHELQGAS
ncbi:MAG: hypothetical protein GY719_19550 [bacterium]|nr:hypothetical protein [bacterium]